VVLEAKADTKRQIDDLVTERAGLKFTRTTQAAVSAARQAADAAEKARDQECGKVGDNCRKRQDAVATALTALAKAQENKAATDRFEEIETELKQLRTHKADDAVGAADPMKALLGTILGAWADLLTAWQKAVFAVIYDLTLVAFMIGIEVLGHTSIKSTRYEDMATKAKKADTPVPATVVMPKPQKPKLVASTATPVGSVKKIITAALESAPGERVEIRELGQRYRDVCRSEGKPAASMDAFLSEVEAFCRAIG
jgi:hypothetical protein